MTNTHETSQDFVNAVELLGYEEMNSRTISVAAMVLAESESTSVVETNQARVHKKSRWPRRYQYHEVNGWRKHATESVFLPVGPYPLGIDVDFGTTYLEIEAYSQDSYFKRPLVPRALGKLSMGDQAPGHNISNLVLTEYIGNDEEKIRKPQGEMVQICGFSAFTQHEKGRAQVKRAAELLSAVISYNHLDIVDPIVRTLEEYQL